MFFCFLCCVVVCFFFFFFSSRRRHTRWPRDWSSDVCSSDLCALGAASGSWQGGRGLCLRAGSMREGGIARLKCPACGADYWRSRRPNMDVQVVGAAEAAPQQASPAAAAQGEPTPAPHGVLPDAPHVENTGVLSPVVAKLFASDGVPKPVTVNVSYRVE